MKEIEFSGSTYQVLVTDQVAKKDVWVFLQLEGKNEIKDAFCSCDELQENRGCFHIALAYVGLFNGYKEPLHQRFTRSLWNQLCSIYEERIGDDPASLIHHSPSQYYYQSALGKILFRLQILTPLAEESIKALLYERLRETEESSLKFSNLSLEELTLWKQGKPNSHLRYALSYWCDLAKWLLKKQESGEEYQIQFKYSKKNLPQYIQINFSDIRIDFYLSEANLPFLIESLQTVKSPLGVFYIAKKAIKCITYDAKSHLLHVEETVKTSKKSKSSSPGISVGGWNFIPEEGFYAEELHELLKTPVLYGEDLIHTLTEHTRLVASFMVDYVVHIEPTPLSYALRFDADWNLHITAYIYAVGDLTTENSWLIENWAFVEEDGFYCIEGNYFQDIEFMVPTYQISDFVSQNRVWLNSQEAFQTHVRSIEYQLEYQVSAQKRLTFVRHLVKNAEKLHQQDFGSWVYVEGHGFYSKTMGSFHFLLKPGVSLSPEQVPLFIHMNRDELTLIPKFFDENCAVAKTGLRVELLSDKKKIQVLPEYKLKSHYQGKTYHLFDDFVYVEGCGFHELPIDARLPEKFRHPIELEGEELIFFLTNEVQMLRKHISFLDPSLRKPRQDQLVVDLIEQAVHKGRGWYRFRFFLQTDVGLIPLSAIYQQLQKKFPFAFFDAGLVDLREERFDWLKKLDKTRLEKSSQTILLTTLEFMQLHAFNPLEFLPSEKKHSESSMLLLEQLVHLHTPEEPNPKGLLSHLRPYQEVGVRWLWFLYRQQLSGLLCDDMGLGKTHQAMALIASIMDLYGQYAEGTSCHFLIVCPTSVIYHWQEKLYQFLPMARVCVFHGTNRKIESFQEEYDILLTSYGTLRNEQKTLAKIPFEVAILDEIQIAKNHFSQVYQALVRLKAHMKIGLTGTPIENRLRELKSLFDIVLPTYMPGDQEYRDLFIKPIEKERSAQRKKLLNRLIHPFILRRKKEDVLKDLPEKTENISYCSLLPHQYQLYTEVLHQKRYHLLEKLQDDKTPIPFLHVFALLSSLKQICNHPAMYLKDVENYKHYASGKWELFVELLREARESKQKVVVFSQYLNMLDIIEAYLKEKNIGFASLRGNTHNRKEQLILFNQDPQCEVFVGSLHAAGLGIDLTAASVVIHYDRWWNAARENQATDRVHRIGQMRGVQVFKLVTKGTFEEEIHKMIMRKGNLMEETIGVDEENMFKSFSREELMNLLKLIEKEEEMAFEADIE